MVEQEGHEDGRLGGGLPCHRARHGVDVLTQPPARSVLFAQGVCSLCGACAPVIKKPTLTQLLHRPNHLDMLAGF